MGLFRKNEIKISATELAQLLQQNTDHRRPCLARGERALFHCWADNARPGTAYGTVESEAERRFQLWSVGAIVEFEDGTCRRVWPSEVQFLDGGNFDAYDWDDLLENQNGGV